MDFYEEQKKINSDRYKESLEESRNLYQTEEFQKSYKDDSLEYFETINKAKYDFTNVLQQRNEELNKNLSEEEKNNILRENAAGKTLKGKKKDKVDKAQQKIIDKTKALVKREGRYEDARLDEENLDEELSIMRDRIELIKLKSKEAKGRKGVSDEEKLYIAMKADKMIIDEYSTMILKLKDGSGKQKKLVELKEKMTLQYIYSKTDYEISQLKKKPENAALVKQREKQRRHHHDHDYIHQPFMSVFNGRKFDGAFKERGHVSIDVRGQEQDKDAKAEVVNTGRQTMGGTKPMYKLVDSKGNAYLLKKGVAAAGILAPDRSYITETGSRLQQMIDPNNYIHARVYKNSDGEAVGNYQEFVKSMDSKNPEYLKLQDWQQKIDEQALSKKAADGILKAHVLDWLLCNFDTKGENFIQKENGEYVAIDKEASFKFLNKEEAQTMNTQYRPHNDNTIYNVVFGAYAEGNKNVKPDFSVIRETVDKISKMDSKDYKALFKDFAQAKKGRKSEKYLQKIDDRRIAMQKEYGRFFGQLIKDRYNKLGGENGSDEEVKALFHDLDENGHYKMI